MTAIRTFLARHRLLAIWLVAAAFMLKALVPAGFMPVLSHGEMLIQLCTGQGAQTIVMELPGKSDDRAPADHKKAETLCIFSGLSAPTLAAADPILLAVAIAFVLAMGFVAVAFAPRIAPPFLRPPPIGPPTEA